ncbi:F-box protein At5g18160-like [Triticum dicoccoides]|uniref:F-box protein At5g18160-like n=1 Tax=Triticum dicoccoides TaxID=85692 RepID=UPI001891A233|nr:F-box protein At5g18160-like [Triticum dicoccoides]XP_044436492.1 F-box protein At5g18160-like [Triticum aestivum]
MPGKRVAALLEDLPEEIVDLILVRLPPRDVGRCRAVCRSWRGATSMPEFMLEHHRRQPPLPIIDGFGRPASLVVVRDAGSVTTNQQLWPFVPGLKHRNEICLQGTCEGFIVVSWRDKFYICNPVIRKHALLPRPRFGQGIRNAVVGFYRHHPTGEHRVLWVSESKHLSESSLYVLTVGSDEPRHVRVRMTTVSSASNEQLLMALKCSKSIQHGGSLHWRHFGDRVRIEDGEDIIVFDTEDESFWWMRSPAQLYDAEQLFDMKGALAFSGFSGGILPKHPTLDVWTMQDYKAEIWSFKYRIDLPRVEASRQLDLISLKRKRRTPLDTMVRWFNEMVVLNERELLIHFNSKYALRCDINGKFLGMVNIGKKQYCMFFTEHCLQESIIPIIPSHEMQEEDEDPPFSTRHV